MQEAVGSVTSVALALEKCIRSKIQARYSSAFLVVVLLRILLLNYYSNADAVHLPRVSRPDLVPTCPTPSTARSDGIWRVCMRLKEDVTDFCTASRKAGDEYDQGVTTDSEQHQDLCSQKLLPLPTIQQKIPRLKGVQATTVQQDGADPSHRKRHPTEVEQGA